MPKGKTLDFKKKQCANCKQADKRALRMGRNHCPFPNPTIRNGHCKEFDPIKKKREKVSADA